jgi:hypothetical protein
MVYDHLTKLDQALRAFELGTNLTEERLNDHSRMAFIDGSWIKNDRGV